MTNQPDTVANILVVDDNPANLKLLASMLKKYGYKVRPVPNGKLALSGARAIPPDIILLDINMPEMNGFEVCQQLKSHETTRDIPVIFISALNETLDKVTAFNVGGVDYVTKPFQMEEVLARVKTHLTLHAIQQELEAANASLAEQVETERALSASLKQALDRVKVLSGLLPICANCKKIRDDDGYWHQVEVYVERHSDASFSHGICPDCRQKLYPELYGD